MTGIDELVEFVRAGLDADEDVAIDLDRAAKFPERVPDFYGAGGPAAKYLRQRFSTHRVLAEVAAKRRLLDQALAWGHYEADDPWYSCPASDHHAKAVGAAGLCECGRDERVHAVITMLTAPYEETT